MSRRISEDFNAFSDFLQKYNLNSYNSAEQQVEECKAMHKKLYGLMIFTSEFKYRGQHNDCAKFLDEVSSDLLISLFCAVQGMYKPAKLQLRCSIENLLKALVSISVPHIVEEKSVYAIFDAAKVDKHFLTTYGVKSIASLKNDYSTLCRTVHGDPTVMHPTSALALLPQYDVALLQDLATLYTRMIENSLGILYLNYPALVDSMHPENKKDFLDCLSKATKGEIVNILFG
ncbi:MAG TPA: hypothetical protein PKB13_08345 [Clostridia bacterium]|nr:hypothetical protein [Clostridia bacterium]